MHSLHYVKVCASLRLLAPEACQSRCVSGNLNTIPTRHSRRAFFRTQDGLPRDDCHSRKCAHKHAFGMGRAPILKHFGETMELCELWDVSQKRLQRNIEDLFFTNLMDASSKPRKALFFPQTLKKLKNHKNNTHLKFWYF